MSLGLNDLQKKRRKAEADKKAAESAADSNGTKPDTRATTSGSWARTHTARPWSSAGLSKGARPRKKALASDAVMNEEWISVHAPPIFWHEVSTESRLHNLQMRLAALENRVQDVLNKPLRLLRGIYEQIIR
jgi:hypothetical protein